MNAPLSHHHPLQSADPSRFRAVLILPLLSLGIAGWIFFFGKSPATFLTLGPWGWRALLLFTAIIIAVSLVPLSAAIVHRCLSLLRTPSVKSRRWSTVIAAVLTAGYLYQTAMAQQRQLRPYVHDEFSYLIQAHQFAAGHLWMPAHPLAPFFDSFQLFVSPVYASPYFPGTALLYVPGIWLHLPAWITSLAIAGVIAGLLYRVTTELIDGIAGWLAVLLLWSDRVFRFCSTMTLAQLPLLMFGLLAVLSWLKWNQSRRKRCAVVIGLFTGLAAVTRPVDALCFAVPIAIAMCFDLLDRDTGLLPVRAITNFEQDVAVEIEDLPHGPEARVTVRFVTPILCVIAGAMPLLILQLILNHGITGHALETPFRVYADRDYPGTAYGFHPFDPTARPASDLPQKMALYLEYQPIIARHQPGSAIREAWHFRLPLTLTQATPTPFPLLLPILPIAVLGLTRRRNVLLTSLPIFLLLYTGYVFFFSHYVLTASAAVIVGVLVGAEQFAAAFPNYRRLHTVFWALSIAGLAIAALPQWDASARDEQFDAPLIADVNRRLATLPHTPAIVLFTYDPKRNSNEEPVYNADVAWPDDAPIIRAHDRAKQNVDLFQYYAEHQPGRFVYRFEERSRILTALGNVKQLAHRQ